MLDENVVFSVLLFLFFFLNLSIFWNYFGFMFFKVFFVLKYIKIILFFYFLKYIFNISISK